MKIFSKLALVLTLLTSGVASANTESAISGCQGAFDEEGDTVTILPFNSTICGDDEMARILFKLFPVASELSSSAIVKLENREALIQHAIEEKEERSYTVPLEAVEQSGVEIASFFEVLAMFALCFHIGSHIFVAMTTNGGDFRSGLKYLAASAVCFGLVYPFNFGSRINPDGETNMASVISASVGFAGIGFANHAISSTASYMSRRGLSNEVARGFEIESSEQAPYAQAKEMIEEAMCLDSVALAGVYDAAENERMAARRSILRGGELETLAFKDDGNTSRFTVDTDKRVIESGWRLNDDEHRSLCTSRNLIEPDASKVSDNVKRAADKIADKLQIEGLDRNKLVGAWNELEGELGDNASVTSQLEASEYLYSRILWRSSGGDVDTNAVSRDLFNDRAAKASEFAREIRAGKCYADYIGFKNTERTIKSMNNGRVDAPEFTLDCAIVRDGQLEMIFDGDASSVGDFANRGLAELNEHPYKAVKLHEELMATFEVETLVKKTLTSVHAGITVDDAIEETNDNGFHDRLIEARTQGVLMFGVHGVRMVEAWLGVRGVLLNSQAESSGIESTVTKDSYYVGENGFLPSDINLEAPAFVMPAFVYHVTSETDNNDAATTLVESQLESQLDGGQGGTAASMVKSTGAIYQHAGAETTTTQTDLLDESAGTIIDSLTTITLNLESKKGLSSGEVRRRTSEMCVSNSTSESDVEALGIKLEQYNAVCARNSVLAVTHYKTVGFKSVDHAAALMVVAAGSKTGGKLMTMFKKKKGDKGASSKQENDGQISGKSLPSAGMPSSFKSKVMSTVSKLANASFIQYISGALVGLTVAFATITTVIYLLPSLMFSFVMVSLTTFLIAFTALSGTIAMAYVIFGGDAQRVRQPIVSGIVNLMLKMMIAVLTLYLSVAAIQVADTLSALVGSSATSNHESSGLGFASGLIYDLLAAVISLWALLWLMRSGVSVANTVTDKLEKMMGGSDVGGSNESAINAAVVIGAQGSGDKAKAGANAISDHISGNK